MNIIQYRCKQWMAIEMYNHPSIISYSLHIVLFHPLPNSLHCPMDVDIESVSVKAVYYAKIYKTRDLYCTGRREETGIFFQLQKLFSCHAWLIGTGIWMGRYMPHLCITWLLASHTINVFTMVSPYCDIPGVWESYVYNDSSLVIMNSFIMIYLYACTIHW